MDKTPRGLLAAALSALLLAGCAYQPGPAERLPDDPQTLLEQARQQEGEQAARSRLEAADILARQGQRTQALEVATNLDEQALSDDQLERWALLLSRLGADAEDPSAVLRATQQLDERAFSRDTISTLRLRQGRALAAIDEHLAAAETLLALQRETEREALNEDIWESLSRLDGQQLAALEDDDALTAGWIELARLTRESGSDVERLFARLETWRERNARHPAARQVPSELLALRELRGQEVRHVAVFLPESGPLDGVAEAIREGIRTHHLNAVERNGGVRLSFLDSSFGDLDVLYAEARDRGAQVVIGPLDKKLVTRLESRDRLPLPTLALNYGQAENSRTEGLYQYGLSAEDEARQVARRARQDGHRRAAMLIPDNEWGHRVGRAFEQEWDSRDGTITQRVTYDPSGSATESTRRALAGDPPDMLFLLAPPSYARQVPPTLDYYDAAELPIYATSHLYEGRPQPLLDHDLDDVSFVDIPWQIPDAAVGGEEALPYLASYRALREDADPTLFRLMAMGVDAYELALRLPQFRLLPDSELFGATGTLHPGVDGRIQRRLPWARFENGRPRPILVTDFLNGNGLDDDTLRLDGAPLGSQPLEAPEDDDAARE